MASLCIHLYMSAYFLPKKSSLASVTLVLIYLHFSVLFQNRHGHGVLRAVSAAHCGQKCVTTPAFNKQGRADQFCFSPAMFAACQKATACRKGWNASCWHGADMRSKDNFSPNQGRSDQNECVEWSFKLTPIDTWNIFFVIRLFSPLIIYVHVYITNV